MPVIIGRSYLETWRVLVDMERNKLKFWLKDEVVSFDICQSIKQRREMSVVLVIDVVD